MVFPKGLQIGDTIGIVAPSSPFDNSKIPGVEKALNKLGYKVKFGKSCYENYKGYLAGSDELRAKDLEDMFLDSEIDAVLCMRGGYGTPRILDMIDYNIIKNNPKPFIGFSDITALHVAFNQKCDLITFHGIMGLTSPKWDDFTYESLVDAINMKEYLNIRNPKKNKVHTLVDGVAEGEIIGGNLALLSATIGTEYEIDTKGKILFIEEIGEPIYRIDRMLTQLALAGKFDDCSGIIFGDFTDCNKQDDGDFEIEEIIIDRVEKYKKPCIYNLKSGHCMPMITIPFGVKCKLDASEKKVELFK